MGFIFCDTHLLLLMLKKGAKRSLNDIVIDTRLLFQRFYFSAFREL